MTIRGCITLVVLALLLAFAGSASAATFTPSLDTSYEQGLPTTTFATGNDLVEGYPRHVLRLDGSPFRIALLKFSNVTMPNAPYTATLRVYKRVGSPSESVPVNKVDCSAWSAATTWNTRPALGAFVAQFSGYPAPGAGWMETMPFSTTADATGSVCLALDKDVRQPTWITADSMEDANPPQLVVASQPQPPPPPPPTPSGVEPCGGTPVTASPSTIKSVIAANNSVTINATPGSYANLSMHKTTPNSCVEIHCTASAKIGEGPNNSGCLLTGQTDIESIHNLTIEGFVIKASGGGDYGFALYDESPDVNMHARLANNVFNGSLDHDISTKERVEYAEVVDNIFINCRRHCWEIGQNGNIPSRPSTTGTAIFRGNIASSLINVLTQRYNVNLTVENNDFRSVAGYVVNSWPFWTTYLGSSNMVPGTETPSAAKVPLRTTLTGNKFSSGNRLRFTGRGVIDDVVLIRGNTGSPSCARGNMDSQNAGTAAAHSNEETTAPPQLDSTSDLACPIG